MRHNVGALFRELERDVRNERPIAPTLRKLILFGGQVGSPKLREWARSELTGYTTGDEVPTYRKVPAIIQMDGATQFSIVKGQRVGVFDLPDFAQGDIDEKCTFRGPIAEIEAMSNQRDPKEQSVKVSLPMAREGHVPLSGVISGLRAGQWF